MAGGMQTIPRVLLGEALKQLRAEAGITLDAAARAVGKDRPRLIKVLDGRATLSTEELGELMDFLGAREPARSEILALGAQARKRAAGTPYMDLAPGAFRRFAWLEAMAQDILVYDTGIYPALIQSPEYTDALLATAEDIWWTEPGTMRANLATFRAERQRMTLRAERPKRIELIFTEATLNTVVGGPAVMRGQLRHVLEQIERYPNLAVRIVPATAVGNPAQQGGLTLLGFGEVLRPLAFLPVVYGPSTYFDSAEDTERIRRAFDRIRDLSLSVEETAEMVRSRLTERA